MKIYHPAKPNKQHPQYYFTCLSKEITCRRQSGWRNFTRLRLILPLPSLRQLKKCLYDERGKGAEDSWLGINEMFEHYHAIMDLADCLPVFRSSVTCFIWNAGFLDYPNLRRLLLLLNPWELWLWKKVILHLDGQKPTGLFWLAFRLNDIWHSQLLEVSPNGEWPWVWEAWG